MAKRPMPRSAQDKSAEWLGEVVNMEDVDAQRESGASEMEPDEVDIHGLEVGPV